MRLSSDRIRKLTFHLLPEFIESRYGLDMNGLTVSNINRAIINGEKKGVFILPKGASGKVKLAKPVAEDKEVSYSRVFLGRI